jgi:phosphate transport system ATP-binding protein
MDKLPNSQVGGDPAGPQGAAAASGTERGVIVEDFSAFFGTVPALAHINLNVYPCERLAIIGPASSGKTTFLRSLNRMNDLEWGFSRRGRILVDGRDVYDEDTDVPSLRRKLGMVFAVPTAMPWSVYENVTFGPPASATAAGWAKSSKTH